MIKNVSKKYKKLLNGFLCLSLIIVIGIGIYCFNGGWSYYFFDITVKAISGIGAILAGLFVYIKWQDEKTRSLYEKSLQEVYAPLINELIKQEEYRHIICPELSQKDAPILCIKVTTTHHKFNISTNGINIDESKEEHPGILSRENFLTALKKDSYSLASPSLLNYLNRYELLLELEKETTKTISDAYPTFKSDTEIYDQAIQTDEGKKLLKISHRRYQIELDLIKEISFGYNNCVKKLDMYAEGLEITIRDD